MTTDYVCPNGHVFPGALTVPCDECGAAVVCEPIAAGIRLHEALEAAETRVTEQEAAIRAYLAGAPLDENGRFKNARLEPLYRAIGGE